MSSKKRIRSHDSFSSNWSNGSIDKESKSSDKYNNERVINSEHELFLQAFEKPTQIYRFLRTRQLVSPIFLNRTLTYMRHRLSRNNNKRRKDFSVDSLLKYVIDKKQKEAADEESSGNLTLNFLCIKNQSWSSEYSAMTLETTLLKLCHQKRKDVMTPYMQFSVGKCEMKVNSEESDPNCLTIYKNELSESNGHLVKQWSYSLLFRASYPKNPKLVNGNYVQIDCKATDISLMSDNSRAESSSCKKRKIQDETDHYMAELIIYDKQKRCLLTDGEYTVVLQPCLPPNNKFGRYNKFASWEALDPEDCDNLSIEDNTKHFGSMDIFRKGPVLRFQLSWSCLNTQNVNINGLNEVLTNKSLDVLNNNENNSCIVNNISDNSSLLSYNVNVSSNALLRDELKTHNNICNNNNIGCNGKKPTRVTYQFLFNNNTRQQTKPQNDYHCPWCSLNCQQLYSLIKHLKLCHNRFTFTYVPDLKCARIDVAINDCYDGSYAGNPHDLSFSNTGFAFSRNGPVRRNPVTHVIVCRPKRSPHSMTEFDEPDDEDVHNGRSYVSGHNRLYYHTNSCLPIRPQEMEYDSEAENDPQWMKDKTQLMIDEFTDVNEGEKEVMKMWNLHIMKNGFVGDCQIPLACHMFVEQKGMELIDKNLYKNFILHLCNLFDFGLLSASALVEIIREFDQIKKEHRQQQQRSMNQLVVKQEIDSSFSKHF